MNFVFLSPNFPENYYMFCQGLKNNGITTLGIGDAPYEQLRPELKTALTEYYKVNSLENYDEVVRAMGYFTFKYGKIDWLESNNEYWILRDAKLRTDFNVTTGVRNDVVDFIKYKSKMKACYAAAGVPTARCHLCTTMEDDLKFIAEVEYPVIVKPDNGVGAAATYKLKNDEDLKNFYETKPADVPYLMEEFVNGTIVSYDGICDSNRNPIFETSHYFPDSIMDIVLDVKEVFYWSEREIPEDLKDAGRRTIAAFPTQNRFFHCEFFRLNEDKKGLGKKGDIVGLEVNMRPPGGYTPDMMNFANNINVYQIWADMVAFDKSEFDKNRPYHCVYVGRRDGRNYVHTMPEVVSMYSNNIRMQERLPEVLSGAMGNDTVIAVFETKEQVFDFVKTVLAAN